MNYGIFWDEYRSVKQSHSSKVPSTPDSEDGSDRKDGKIVLICFFFSIQTAHHVTYTFQSESTLCSCLNVKELIARNRRDIWSLSDCNGTRTHNHLVRKQTLNLLAKLARLVNGWVFVCELSGCGFEFRWSHKMSILRSSKHLHDFEW